MRRLTKLLVVSFCVPVAFAGASPWRSTLYPINWTPQHADAEGRFLHDFSYAGYESGQRPLPPADSPATVTLQATDDEADDTARIQEAIDRVGENGGGVVLLGPGTFRVAPPEGSRAALHITHNGVVLRGSGPEATTIINTDPNMRQRDVIRVAPPNTPSRVWLRASGEPVPLAVDAENRSTRVRLAESAGVEAGDWIVLLADATDEFIADHDMTGLWNPRMGAVAFYRRVARVSSDGLTVEIDIPLRYPLPTRDNARLQRTAPHLEQVGVESLSIGMVEHPGEGFAANDYREEGTAAHEVHGAHIITFYHTVNAWIRDIHTARPETNEHDIHMVSNGFLLHMSRNITVTGCVVRKPQYKGAGGNGYGITFSGSDCLVTDSRVTHARHNFSFKSLWTSGNVVHRSRAEDAMLASDFHMHLSPANLFDAVTVNRDWLEARYRPWGTIVHGHPTTQSVFWNTIGEAAHPRAGVVVDSRQFGWGYVIGTQGEATGVRTRPVLVPGSGPHPARDTSPEDFVEGVGEGATLVPQSLYEDQLRRRLGPRDRSER
ncbi:MAG: hypothetical protein EA423_07835 [Phycisphaerales bacterium]|nr:MAG: hypothetical protein EA423_07835 [Phycisphaerales bacterium]